MTASLEHETEPPLLVLATFGTLGDLRPFLLLAASLRDRGHRVMLVAPGFHERSLIESGLPHRMYGTVADAESVLADPDLWHPRKGIAVLLHSLLPCIDAVSEVVVELAATQRIALICHAVLLPAAEIARARGAAMSVLGIWLAPSNLRTYDDPLTIGALSIPPWLPMALRRWVWRQIDRYGIDPHILPGLNALRAEAGLPAVRHFAPYMQQICDVSIGLFPGWFGPRRSGWPEPFIDGEFPLSDLHRAPDMSPALTQFLGAGTAPIVFTAGTGMRQANQFFEAASLALKRMRRRGVFVTAHADQLPATSSPHVHREPFVDFSRLLPVTAAIVHHGGIGTTAEALRAGTPQLITPFGFDQFDNAARIRALGVGDSIPAARVNARRLCHALERLLASPTVVSSCRAIASRFATRDASTILADRIEAAIGLAA